MILDPADYEDVMVTVAHPSDDIEASLASWIQVPLQYRNTAESRRLQRLGLLPAPWGPPADEPASATWPGDWL